MRFLNTVAILALVVLGGCWLDGPTGMVKQPDGTVTYDASKDTVGAVVRTAETATKGTPVGWVVSAGAAALAVWQALRASKVAKALAVTVDGVEAFSNTEAGKAVAEEMKEWLNLRHNVAGVQKIVQPLVDKFGHAPE